MAVFRVFRGIRLDQLWDRSVAILIGQLLKGKTNNVGQVTLEPNTLVTVVQDELVTRDSWVGITPMTDSAATRQDAYIPPESITPGTFEIHHTIHAALDQTFRYVIIG